jgi:hypothetical protein
MGTIAQRSQRVYFIVYQTHYLRIMRRWNTKHWQNATRNLQEEWRCRLVKTQLSFVVFFLYIRLETFFGPCVGPSSGHKRAHIFIHKYFEGNYIVYVHLKIQRNLVVVQNMLC